MRAVVVDRFGSADGLRLTEVERPSPMAGEVLIQIHAATVTVGDVVSRSLPFVFWLPMRLLMGLKRKRIPGHELAGVVEAVGPGVQTFNPGDRVFGTTSGLSVGAAAEYVCLPEARSGGVLAPMPVNLSFAEAAALPVGGLTALYFLRKGQVGQAHTALIYGASGSVGTYAVQLARHFGASVTGVCSGANIELVQSLGAERVIDYTRHSLRDESERYDLVFDAVAKADAAACRSLLTSGGQYVTVGGGLALEAQDELEVLVDLVESGVVKPVIDRRFSMADTAEAHRYVETGRKRGNVVIDVIA